MSQGRAAGGSVFLTGFRTAGSRPSPRRNSAPPSTGLRASPGSPDWIAAELRKLLANAEVLDHDWHHWCSGLYACGSWVATPVGTNADFNADAWAPEGRIAFASSDIAREQAGWFEAAVISGKEAAAAVVAMSLT